MSLRANGHTGSIIAGVNFDEIEAAYPNATTEEYTYKKNGNTVAKVTVVYTDSTKDCISSVTRSRS